MPRYLVLVWDGVRILLALFGLGLLLRFRGSLSAGVRFGLLAVFALLVVMSAASLLLRF
jgi:hypothetical protein